MEQPSDAVVVQHEDVEEDRPASPEEMDQLQKELTADCRQALYGGSDEGPNDEEEANEAQAFATLDVKDLKAQAWPALGFAVTALIDVATALIDPRKMRQWFLSMKRLVHFLFASGVWTDLLEGFATPRLISNLSILGQLQQEGGEGRNRRRSVALESSSLSRQEKKNIMFNAARYIRTVCRTHVVVCVGKSLIISLPRLVLISLLTMHE